MRKLGSIVQGVAQKFVSVVHALFVLLVFLCGCYYLSRPSAATIPIGLLLMMLAIISFQLRTRSTYQPTILEKPKLNED